MGPSHRRDVCRFVPCLRARIPGKDQAQHGPNRARKKFTLEDIRAVVALPLASSIAPM